MERLLTGIALATGWMLLLLYGPPLLFALVVCGLGLMALHEYCRMALTGATEAALRPFLILTMALPLLAALFGRLPLMAAGLTLACGCLAFLAVRAYQRLVDPFAFLSRALFGALFIGFGAAHLPLLAWLPGGNRWLLLLTLVVVASDAGAYYTGTHFGRRKLCPAVSPNKTVEGLLGGLTGAVVVAMLASPLLPTPLPAVAAAGLFLAAAGALGDLIESVLKRAMGAKDSGALLPGHGGILDRADSLLLAAPLLYYLLILGVL